MSGEGGWYEVAPPADGQAAAPITRHQLGPDGVPWVRADDDLYVSVKLAFG